MLASQAAKESRHNMAFIRCKRDEYTVYDLNSDQHFKLLGSGPIRFVNPIPAVDGPGWDWEPLNNDSMFRAIKDCIEASCDQESESPETIELLVDTDRILLALLKMASILSDTLKVVTDREDENVLCIELTHVSQLMRDYIEENS